MDRGYNDRMDNATKKYNRIGHPEDYRYLNNLWIVRKHYFVSFKLCREPKK